MMYTDSKVIWCFVIRLNVMFLYHLSCLSKHAKSVKFEKGDVRTIVTGRIGVFIQCMRHMLEWGFQLFLFRETEMKVVYEITVSVIRFRNKMDHFYITNKVTVDVENFWSITRCHLKCSMCL